MTCCMPDGPQGLVGHGALASLSAEPQREGLVFAWVGQPGEVVSLLCDLSLFEIHDRIAGMRTRRSGGKSEEDMG